LRDITIKKIIILSEVGLYMLTYKEIIDKAQAEIVSRGKDIPNYPVEQFFRDMDLIEDLTKLKIKYRDYLDEK
jgi:hypothetical protein